MIRDFMIDTGIVETSREYDFLMCLGEIEVLKKKSELQIENPIYINDISVHVTDSHIIIQKGDYVAKVENKLENAPNLYLAYWNAKTYDPMKHFKRYGKELEDKE